MESSSKIGRTATSVLAANAASNFGTPDWTPPWLKSRLHRSCLFINVCHVHKVPSPPRGRRWPLGRMRGDFLGYSVEKRPSHPGPLPRFLARTLPCDTTLHPQKKSGERGQHGAVQLSIAVRVNPMPCNSTPDADQKRHIRQQKTVRSPGAGNSQVSSCGNPANPGQSKQPAERSENQGRRQRRSHNKLGH